MSKITTFDPMSTEIKSPLVAGLTEAVSKISDVLNMQTTTYENVPMTEIFIDDTDRYRMYQVDMGKKLWLSDPTPVIRKNGSIINSATNNFSVDLIGGSVSFEPQSRMLESDSLTATFTSIKAESKVLYDVLQELQNIETKLAKDKGFYETYEDLKTSYPTGNDGDFAVVGTTDTMWVWDTTTTDWKDTFKQTDLSNFYTKAEADGKLALKEAVLNPYDGVGNAPDYYFGGNKQWIDVLYKVRNTLLAGVDITAIGTISELDNMISAFGKLQKQITDNIYILPTATATVKGGVKIGKGFEITTDGLLSTIAKPTILGYYFGENQSDPAVTWYGDCVGFTAEIASTIDSVAINNFDNVFPFNQFEEVTIGSDIMIKIPKFYHKHITPTDTIDGKTGQIGDLISDIQIDGSWTIHDAFRKGNGIGYNDYVYISKYETSNNNQSISGATVQASQTSATFRTNARAKGSGWSQLEFTTWNLQQILMTLVLKTRDSQLKMKGNYSGAVKTTGLTNGAKSTCLQLSNTASSFYGIENPFGNVYKWCDGLNFSDGQIYCCYDISKFADDTTASYTRVGYDKIQTNGYVSELGHDSNHKTISLPTTVIGSASTYYCDYYYQATGWRVPRVGGDWTDSAYSGVFYWVCSISASDSSSYIGSRLVLKPI